jgi:hypothetical protein
MTTLDPGLMQPMQSNQYPMFGVTNPSIFIVIILSTILYIYLRWVYADYKKRDDVNGFWKLITWSGIIGLVFAIGYSALIVYISLNV